MREFDLLILFGMLLLGWAIVSSLLTLRFDTKKRNAILELSFYCLLCLFAIMTVSLEFRSFGEIGTTVYGLFTAIFMISYFTFELFLKFDNRFTVVHHISLSIVVTQLFFNGYVLAVLPLLFLYELPGIVDVLNIHFVDKNSKYKKDAYLTGIVVRLLNTGVIGPIVLVYTISTVVSYQGQCTMCGWNLSVAILSVGLNLFYTVNSVRLQINKLQSLSGSIMGDQINSQSIEATTGSA